MTELVVPEQVEEIVADDSDGSPPEVEDIEEETPSPYKLECWYNHFEATSEPVENQKLKEVELWDFPDSYKNYNIEEQRLIKCVTNFKTQYVNLYPEAPPLLLTPYNDCNVQKFVTLTIVSTLLKYSDLFMWESCSRFVSDFLSLELLPCPYKLPRTLFSPNTVLARQCGNCFEYSNVLCSLLLGAGYDAYVVSGYSSREICQMEEKHKEWESPEPSEVIEEISEGPPLSKYTSKPPRTLSSRYMKSEIDKAAARNKKEQENIIENEKKLQKEREMPDSDTLFGYRVHSWILVRAGKREVVDHFFIEPLTGTGKSVEDSDFLGVESIWNEQNYWVCLKKGQEGIRTLTYDLEDSTVWENMLPTEVNVVTSLVDEDLEEDLDDIIQEDKPAFKMIKLPKSWCLPVHVNLKNFKTHNKNAKRICYYNRRRVETFTPYSMPEGIVRGITLFSDYEQNKKVSVDEFYKNRADRLQRRLKNFEKNTICDFFESGRENYLKEHEYGCGSGDVKRTMRFYPSGRLDCLSRREMTANKIVEFFEGRDDSMFYRKVDFAKKTIKFQTPEEKEIPPRTIWKICEEFSRNRLLEAGQDIAKLTFDLKVNKIYVVYHVDDHNLFPATHIFVKGATSDEKVSEVYFDEEMHISFNPKVPSTLPKTSEMYKLLLSLVQHENKSKMEIYESEKEVRSILKTRDKDETELKFTTSHFDLLRSKDIKKIRTNMEETAKREMIRKMEMQLDYLGPYLALFDDPAVITVEQASKVREMCLTDLKITLVKRANYIQSRFHLQTEELKKKQKWYQQNQISLSKDEEIDYIKYCSDSMFKINIFELRLQRQKRQAIIAYNNMVKRLDDDPRLGA